MCGSDSYISSTSFHMDCNRITVCVCVCDSDSYISSTSFHMDCNRIPVCVTVIVTLALHLFR